MAAGIGDVREFWEGRARNQQAVAAEVTHPDVWQRWLEIENITALLRPGDRVLDVGCGNGYTTRRIAPRVGEVLGVDFSPEMIARATEECRAEPEYAEGRLRFETCDVLDLAPSRFGMFDLAITERCLINLPSWDAQKRAIANIASVLKPGGRLVFIEGSQDGRRHLNDLRVRTGLQPMPAVWHNLDFDEAQLLAFVDAYFHVAARLHFGVYDFISRVVHPLVVAPEDPVYDSAFNRIAAQLAFINQEFETVSRVLFLVLRRR